MEIESSLHIVKNILCSSRTRSVGNDYPQGANVATFLGEFLCVVMIFKATHIHVPFLGEAIQHHQKGQPI